MSTSKEAYLVKRTSEVRNLYRQVSRSIRVYTSTQNIKYIYLLYLLFCLISIHFLPRDRIVDVNISSVGNDFKNSIKSIL
jgi:hypothetical protein